MADIPSAAVALRLSGHLWRGSEDYKSQFPDLRDVMIEIGSGPRQMSRISGMSYNIIQDRSGDGSLICYKWLKIL